MLRRAFASIPAGWIDAVDIPVTFDLLDPMEVVYHGAYPKFLEAARSNLLGRIGWGYPEMREAGYAFPVVDMSIRYAEPARFEDLLEVRAGILAYSPKLTIVYEIRRKASRGAPVPEKPLLTRAQTVQLPVDIASRTTLWEAPEIMRVRLEAAREGGAA